MSPIRLAHLAVFATVALAASATKPLHAFENHPHWYRYYDRAARWANGHTPWHHVYAHSTYGRPLALVVPPTANMHTEYSWGVARTRMTPINHQFGRQLPIGWSGGRTIYATPIWPSDTTQFGIYPVRAPW